MPRGGQRGTEAEFTLSGERLKDAVEAMLYNPGVTVKELKAAEDGKSVKLKLALAADCALGEHYVRLRATSGFSEVKTFWVGQFPERRGEGTEHRLRGPAEGGAQFDGRGGG